MGAAPEGRKYDRAITMAEMLVLHASQELPKSKEFSPCHIQATPLVGRTALFFRGVDSGPHGAHAPSPTDTARNLSLVSVSEVQPKITCIQVVFETENNFVLRPRLALKR